MESINSLAVSCAVQTESDLTDPHNKKSVYEKVDNPMRYKLIQMVSFYKIKRGNIQFTSL